MGLPVRILTTAFWTVFVSTVVWVVASAWDYGIATGLFGEVGFRLVTTLLLGVLVPSSAVLVLYHRRSGGDEEYWTGAGLVYALILLSLSLFHGV